MAAQGAWRGTGCAVRLGRRRQRRIAHGLRRRARAGPASSDGRGRLPFRATGASRAASSRRTSRGARGEVEAVVTELAAALDQLDLVAVRILDEGDHRGAALDGTRVARDLAALRAHGRACRGGVGHLDRDVAVAGAEVVALDRRSCASARSRRRADRRESRGTPACTSGRAGRSCGATPCRARRCRTRPSARDRPRAASCGGGAWSADPGRPEAR